MTGPCLCFDQKNKTAIEPSIMHESREVDLNIS